MVQLLTPYADSERHNAQHYRRTDGRTDNIMMPKADHTLSSSCKFNEVRDKTLSKRRAVRRLNVSNKKN